MKKQLDEAEEQALRTEAETARDGDDAWDLERPRRVGRGSTPTAVLSVRMPPEQLRRIRATAAERNMSITELLLTAVESLMASPGPRVTVAESTRRFAVSGAQLESVNIVSLETYQRINNDAEPTVATR